MRRSRARVNQLVECVLDCVKCVALELCFFILVALVYMVPGAVIGGAIAAIVYFWPFGGAVCGTEAIAVWIFFSLFAAIICRLEKFPI